MEQKEEMVITRFQALQNRMRQEDLALQVGSEYGLLFLYSFPIHLGDEIGVHFKLGELFFLAVSFPERSLSSFLSYVGENVEIESRGHMGDFKSETVLLTEEQRQRILEILRKVSQPLEGERPALSQMRRDEATLGVSF